MYKSMKDLIQLIEGTSNFVTAYHGSQNGHNDFVIGHSGGNSMGILGNYDSVRYAAFFTDNKEFAAQYGDVQEYHLGPFSIRSIIDEEQAKRIAGYIADDLFDEMRERPESQKELRDLALGFSQISKGAWEIWQLFEDEIGKVFYEKASSEYGIECVTFQEDHVVEDEEGNHESIESETFAVLNVSKIKRKG